MIETLVQLRYYLSLRRFKWLSWRESHDCLSGKLDTVHEGVVGPNDPAPRSISTGW